MSNSSFRATGQGLARLMELRRELSRAPSVKVGVVGDGGSHGPGLTNAELLAIHEFGAPEAGIPERSVLRGAAEQFRQPWTENMGRLLDLTVQGKLKLNVALALAGERAVADIRKRVKAHIDPPLKPATIAAKGSSTPLIDTGQLLKSISYEVSE